MSSSAGSLIVVAVVLLGILLPGIVAVLGVLFYGRPWLLLSRLGDLIRNKRAQDIPADPTAYGEAATQAIVQAGARIREAADPETRQVHSDTELNPTEYVVQRALIHYRRMLATVNRLDDRRRSRYLFYPLVPRLRNLAPIVLLRLFRQQIRHVPTDVALNYGLSQAAMVPRETEVAIIPLSPEQERDAEADSLRLAQIPISDAGPRARDLALADRLVQFNCRQSLIVYRGTVAHVTGNSDTDYNHYNALMDPATAKRGDQFHSWLCERVERIRRDLILGRSPGAPPLDCKLGYAYSLTAGAVEQLGRMPLYATQRTADDADFSLWRAYDIYYMRMRRFLQDDSSCARQEYCDGAGELYEHILECCGNYRTLGAPEMARRFWHAARYRLSHDGDRKAFWGRVRSQMAQCLARAPQPSSSRDDGFLFERYRPYLGFRRGAPPQSWDPVTLLNGAGRRDRVGRFLAAVAGQVDVQSYERIVALGASGIIESVLVAIGLDRPFTICFLQPLLDFFPAPHVLEKVLLIDDCFQTGLTMCMAFETLRRRGIPMRPEDSLVAVRRLDPAEAPRSQLADFVWRDNSAGVREGTKYIASYIYDRDRGAAIPRPVIDRTRLVAQGLVESIGAHLQGWLSACIGGPGDSRRMLDACRSSGFYKPWMLFNQPRHLVALAHRWRGYIDAVSVSRRRAIVASSALDLPFLVAMALLDSFVSTDTERETLFLFYDAQDRVLAGLDGGDLSGWDVFVVDSTIKRGVTLKSISRLVGERRGGIRGVCALFSHLSEGEVYGLCGADSLSVERYVAGAAPGTADSGLSAVIAAAPCEDRLAASGQRVRRPLVSVTRRALREAHDIMVDVSAAVGAPGLGVRFYSGRQDRYREQQFALAWRHTGDVRGVWLGMVRLLRALGTTGYSDGCIEFRFGSAEEEVVDALAATDDPEEFLVQARHLLGSVTAVAVTLGDADCHAACGPGAGDVGRMSVSWSATVSVLDGWPAMLAQAVADTSDRTQARETITAAVVRELVRRTTAR